MENIRIKYLDLHVILKPNVKRSREDQKELLANHILNAFDLQHCEENKKLIKHNLRTSFLNNYFKRFMKSRQSFALFEENYKKWLDGFFSPFKNMDLPQEAENIGL